MLELFFLFRCCLQESEGLRHLDAQAGRAAVTLSDAVLFLQCLLHMEHCCRYNLMVVT
jgi:hypothetical protein